MIKLVVTDVDGTIVGKDEILHEEMITFAKELKEAGIWYTIATGRVEGLVFDYIKKMGIEIPYIACNGGTLVQGEKIIERNTIPLRELRELMELADKMEMSLMYSMDGVENAYRETPYVVQQQKEFGRYLKPRRVIEEEWGILQVDKVIVMSKVRDGSIGKIEELCRRLPKEIGYKRYADKSIDILSKESTKEMGVEKLAGYMNIRMEEVLFAGDDLNDIEIIKKAGVGVAVKNAQEPVKKAADYIAQQECYKGVIEAVKKFTRVGNHKQFGVYSAEETDNG